MTCLLKVANEIYGTNFELGVIIQGDATGYPKQTELQINDIEAIDRPIIWVIYNHKNYRYLTNRMEPPVKQPIFTRWSGFAFHEDVQFNDNGEDSASISMDMRRTQVLDFGIGHLVDQASDNGVFVLTQDVSASEHGDEVTRAVQGAFLTPEPNSAAKNGPRGMINVRGQSMTVNDNDIEKIELHRSAPASDTDDRNTVREGIRGYFHPADSVDGSQNVHPEQPLPGSGSGRQETDSELSDLDDDDFGNEEAESSTNSAARLEDSVTFYRVLNHSKRLHPVSYAAKIIQDPVFLEPDINGFEVKTCDILLDLHQPRRIRNGLLITHVRDVHGKEGWVWTRRLQKFENCRGLRRRYHQPRSVGELQRMLTSETLEELLQRAEDRELDLDGIAENVDSTTELIDRILEDMAGEQEWHRLKVYQTKGTTLSCNNNYPVDYDKFELIVQYNFATRSEELNLNDDRIAVSDIDGQLGVLETSGLVHVTDNGWGLRLWHSRSIHRKRPKDDSHWRKPRDDGGDDNESVLSDVQLSYKRAPLDPPARAVEKKKTSPKVDGKGKSERKDDGDDDEDAEDDSPSAGGGKAGTKKPAAKKTGGKKPPPKKTIVKKPAAGKKGNRNSDSTITQNEDDQEDEAEKPVKKKIKKATPKKKPPTPAKGKAVKRKRVSDDEGDKAEEEGGPPKRRKRSGKREDSPLSDTYVVDSEEDRDVKDWAGVMVLD